MGKFHISSANDTGPSRHISPQEGQASPVLERIVEVIKEVPIIKEVKIIEEKIVEKIIHVPVEIIKEIKIIEERIVEKLIEIEKPIEIIKEIEKPIEVLIESIKEKHIYKLLPWAKILMVTMGVTILLETIVLINK